MPVRLALCDLGAPGWGEPWFPHSAVLLLSHVSYGEFVCAVSFFPVFWFHFAIPILFKMQSHFLLQPCCMALCHFAMFLFVLFWLLFCLLCLVWFGSFVFPCLVVFSVSFAS